MHELFANNKRYNSFVGYYKRVYGERLQKLVLDAGFTCPNRDGRLGYGGCTFCDNAAFHPNYSTNDKSLHKQIDEGIEFHRIRYPRAKHYLAYFQAYSNTYSDLAHLRELYENALSHPNIVGIVIGTRPDCVDKEKLEYLSDLSKGKILKDWHRDLQFQSLDKPIITVEYGVESCYDKTLLRINRGHDFQTAVEAIKITADLGLDVGGHFILGLPGETKQMLLDQCAVINSLPLTSVKFHQLQIVKGTVMQKEYKANPEEFLSFGSMEYIDFIIELLERLRPDLCIERIAGEVPPRFVEETPWGLIRNVQLIQLLDKRLKGKNSFQGRLL